MSILNLYRFYQSWKGIYMYINCGNLAYISGHCGAYDNIISNNDTRYGRSATDNYKKYIQSYNQPRIENNISENDTIEEKINKTQDFINKIAQQQAQMPPINFKYNYMPIAQKGLVNKNALLGAAYEEMNNNLSVPLKTMDYTLNILGAENQISMDALDLNRDGNIDIAEYSASILLADMLDEDGAADIRNIDGNITNKGENKLLAYGLSQNKDIAYRTYMSLYQGYNLAEASRNFINNQNNLVKIN